MIARSSIPVISAVGHETDTTIIDYVADMRAPTPSAAAELAVYDVTQLTDVLENYENGLKKLMRRKLQDNRERLKSYEMQLKYVSPAARIRERKTYALSLEERIQDRMQKILSIKRYRLALYVEQMKGLSPLEKLSSGYSYVENAQGQNIRSVEQVTEGELLRIRVKDGTVSAQVTEVTGN